MSTWLETDCIAFNRSTKVGEGPLLQVALTAKQVVDRDSEASLLIFDDRTSALIEVDFRGSADDVSQRLKERDFETAPSPAAQTSESPAGPGRPKLGVVAREVTLLPRHWDWLNDQPGGASVALRKLVEEARRANEAKDKMRQTQEAAYRFMSALAGDLIGFEEATRALFAGNREAFEQRIQTWPADIQAHCMKLTRDILS